MRKLVMALALVAGCYSPTVPNGQLLCSTAHECPSGFHCAADDHCWLAGTDPTGGGEPDLLGNHDIDMAGGAGPDLSRSGGSDLAGTNPADMLGPPPTEPTLTGSTPASPSTSTSPMIIGTAPAGTIVRIYANGACSGAPAATGSAATFASPGLSVIVASNAQTTFTATATDTVSRTSPCSASTLIYLHADVPGAPTVTSTLPPSPSKTTSTISVKGMAATSSTVSIYGNASCTGAALGSGGEAVFSSTGLNVTVPQNAATTLYANASSLTGTGPCSSSSLTFIHDATAPNTSLALVVDGPSGQSLTWTKNSTLATLHWSGFSDALTGLSGFDVAIANDAACSSIVSGSSVNNGSAGVASLSAMYINGTKYYSCVRAVDGATNTSAYVASDGFTIDTIAPTTPGSLTAVPQANGNVLLNWTASTDGGANASGLAGYDIYWCAGAACTPTLQTANVQTTSYTAVGLSPCQTYSFQVVAVDNAGNTATASASAALAINPGALTVVSGAGTIEYSLPPVNGAVSYDLCSGGAANPCVSGTSVNGVRTADFVRMLNPITKYYAMRVNGNGCAGTTPDVLAPQFAMRTLYAPLQSSVAGAQLGAGLAVLGDVNSDGKVDFVAGAAGQRTAFAYSGPNGGPLWNTSGGSGSDNYSGTLGGGGDVDGDGFPDVVVGAVSAATSGNANQGQFYLLSGKDGALLYGPSPLAATSGQLLGNAVTIVGDLDADGRAEFVVCGAGNGVAVGGYCDVYKLVLGAPNTVTSLKTYAPGAVGDRFGSAVAALGDTTGDNVPDFAIGAGSGGAGTGLIYVYSGSDFSLLRKLDGQVIPAGSALGDSLAGAGDVNGDGVPDLVAGGWSSGPGRVMVFSGSDGGVLANQPGFNTATPNPDNFGYAVAAAGDVNGDGYADWAVSAPKATTVGGNAMAGLVYVYSGADQKRLYQFEGVTNGQLGTTLAGGLDVNGDGRPELIAGTQFVGCGAGSNCGLVAVFSPLDEIRFTTAAESVNPLGRQGYAGIFAPKFASGTTYGFSATGGNNVFTFSLPGNGSGNSTMLANGSYTAVGANQCDLVRVTDGLRRSFDTRTFIGSPPGGAPVRPVGLAASVGSASVSLSWQNPASVSTVVEVRTPTQAWSPVAIQPSSMNSYTYGGAADASYKLRLRARKPAVCDSLQSPEIQRTTLP